MFYRLCLVRHQGLRRYTQTSTHTRQWYRAATTGTSRRGRDRNPHRTTQAGGRPEGTRKGGRRRLCRLRTRPRTVVDVSSLRCVRFRFTSTKILHFYKSSFIRASTRRVVAIGVLVVAAHESRVVHDTLTTPVRLQDTGSVVTIITDRRTDSSPNSVNPLKRVRRLDSKRGPTH